MHYYFFKEIIQLSYSDEQLDYILFIMNVHGRCKENGLLRLRLRV